MCFLHRTLCGAAKAYGYNCHCKHPIPTQPSLRTQVPASLHVITVNCTVKTTACCPGCEVLQISEVTVAGCG
jgi:hypothetical protein